MDKRASYKPPVKVIVAHGSYGCDPECGCCGTTWEALDEDGRTVAEDFSFSHSSEGGREAAERFRVPLEVVGHVDEYGHLECRG